VAWYKKGNSLYSLGRFAESIECYDRALEITPQYADAWLNKGNSLVSLRRFGEAIKCYDKALRINPQYAVAWYNKGVSLKLLRRITEAVECYDRALEIKPQYADAWNAKGISLASLGRFAESIKCFDRALEINPQHEDAWYNKGVSLNRLGRYDEEKKCYARAEQPRERSFAKPPEPAYSSKQEPEITHTYQKGSFIGQKYEVQKELGRGGCGIVYLVYGHETNKVYALKTFKDKFLKDEKTREMFRREANVWIDLERHPYIVRAYFVDEVSGQLYIGMEYIAPDETGLNVLEDYLEKQPPDIAQSLRWAIQFCHGMEYAHSRGVSCHRDIKPANIMISIDKIVKITDFGLAGVVGSSVEGGGGGSPYWMPPEQFTSFSACDMRSDIYAFGVVLYQMANGGKLPFWVPAPRKEASREELVRFFNEMYRLHSQAQVPRFDSPLFPLVQRCLEKSPERRYQTFEKLRDDLERMLKLETGEVVKPLKLGELKVWDLINRGYSLYSLGRFAESIKCFDDALEIDSQRAETWNNKGAILSSLGLNAESMKCYDKALEIDPQDAKAWYNKAHELARLGRSSEAFQCYDRALKIKPQFVEAWYNKGCSLYSLGRFAESIECYDRALKINPEMAKAWNNKGNSLYSLGRLEEALECYNRALEVSPQLVNAWNGKGISLAGLGQSSESLKCFDRALEINPQYADAWHNKAKIEDQLGLRRDAVVSYQKFVDVAPEKYGQAIAAAFQRLRELKGS
jgi:tetratricopeptide (TPR) repeat protein